MCFCVSLENNVWERFRAISRLIVLILTNQSYRYGLRDQFGIWSFFRRLYKQHRRERASLLSVMFSWLLFQFPILCSEFFKLTTYVCEVYPAKISLLPEALFKNLMASLEVGLTKYPFRNTISYLSLWENCFRRFRIYVLCFISFEIMRIWKSYISFISFVVVFRKICSARSHKSVRNFKHISFVFKTLIPFLLFNEVIV